MNQPHFRAAFVTTLDAANITHWSGTVYFMAKALADQGVEVVPIDKLLKYRLLFGKVTDRALGLAGISAEWGNLRTAHMSQRMGRIIASKAEEE